MEHTMHKKCIIYFIYNSFSIRMNINQIDVIKLFEENEMILIKCNHSVEFKRGKIREGLLMEQKKRLVITRIA